MKMNNPTIQQSPALRIEAVSINCILLQGVTSAANGNLLTVAESLPAHYFEYLFLMRIIILIHIVRRNAQRTTISTDGRGNVISGGNNGGKSHISYTPYGSIHRTDSSGPDITRFKFTGQEEDKESGLLYYKARYYDPMLGRFLQADSVVAPEEVYGMNRYMYVSGNPVNYGDDSGNIHHNGKQEQQIVFLSYAAFAVQNHVNANPLVSAAIGIAAANLATAPNNGWPRSVPGAKHRYNQNEAITDIGRGMNWLAAAPQHIGGGIEWASGGLQRAADTFNLYTGQANHRAGESGYERSDFGRSDLGRSFLKPYFRALANWGDLVKGVYSGDRDRVTHIVNHSDIVQGYRRNQACVRLAINVALLAMSLYTGYVNEVPTIADGIASGTGLTQQAYENRRALQAISILMGAKSVASSKSCDARSF